jgi:hypothetical protein
MVYVMSHYETFIEKVKQSQRKNPIGLFTPYQSAKDVVTQVVSPVINPIAISLIAGLDALYASFYLVKGLVHAVTLDPSTATSSFNAFGDHFGGFILATIMAVTEALLDFAAIFTRTVASCKKTDKDIALDVDLDVVNNSCCM